MGKQINKLLNANIYLENKSMVGRADEIELPVIKFLMADHKPLGQVGTTQYPAGIDKLEAKIKWNSFYEDTFKKFANPFKALKLMCRGNVDVYEGADRVAQKAYVVYLTGQSNSLPLGTLKQNDNAEFESELSCTYVRLEFDGVMIMEFDAENNIFNVDGVDLLADFRKNLGL